MSSKPKHLETAYLTPVQWERFEPFLTEAEELSGVSRHKVVISYSEQYKCNSYELWYMTNGIMKERAYCHTYIRRAWGKFSKKFSNPLGRKWK